MCIRAVDILSSIQTTEVCNADTKKCNPVPPRGLVAGLPCGNDDICASGASETILMRRQLLTHAGIQALASTTNALPLLLSPPMAVRAAAQSALC